MGRHAGKRVLKADADGLTSFDRLFVETYAKNFDGAKAIAEAFPGTVDKPAAYAKVLLKRPEIQVAVDAIVAERRAKYRIDAERVLLEFATIGFADIRDVVQWDADGLKVTASDDLTPEQAAAIHEITETTDASGKKTIKVKMHPKVTALEALGRHLKLWETGSNVNLLVANLTALPDDTLERRVQELIAKAGATDAEFVEREPARLEARGEGRARKAARGAEGAARPGDDPQLPAVPKASIFS